MNDSESPKENILAGSIGVSKRQQLAARAMRIKLFGLFAMLIVVLVLMKEAGKPERWEWMGFEKTAPEKVDAKDSVILVEPAPLAPDDATAEIANSVLSSSTGLTVVEGGQRQNVSSPPQSLVFDSKADYPDAAAKFWAKLFPRMTLEQKKSLFQLLKRIRNSQTGPTPDQPEFESLIGWIESRRDELHTEMINEISVLAPSSEDAKNKSAALQESQTVWKETELPTFTAAAKGDDFQVANQLRLAKLQNLLDPLILDDVIDLSAVGRAEDVVAWWRIWEKVDDYNPKREPENVEPITPVQLRSQPTVFRGKLVSITGKLKTARTKKLENSKLDFDQFHELWIEPESGSELVCVYSKSLPAKFPAVTTKFQNFNEPVTVVGYFFKTRSYRDAEKQARHCSLILAPTVQWQPVKIKTVAGNTPMPSLPSFLLILLAVGAIATVIAWRVYSNSEHRAYQPGGKAVDRIESSLKVLSSDPEIKSDAEKFKERYDEA